MLSIGNTDITSMHNETHETENKEILQPRHGRERNVVPLEAPEYRGYRIPIVQPSIARGSVVVQAPLQGHVLIVPTCDLEEWSHIYQNRLGELCGARKPSERQIQIAKIEADAWAAKQRKAKAE